MIRPEPTHPVGPRRTTSIATFRWGVFRGVGRLNDVQRPAGLDKLRTPGRRGQPAARAYTFVAGKPAFLSDSLLPRTPNHPLTRTLGIPQSRRSLVHPKATAGRGGDLGV